MGRGAGDRRRAAIGEIGIDAGVDVDRPAGRPGARADGDDRLAGQPLDQAKLMRHRDGSRAAARDARIGIGRGAGFERPAPAAVGAAEEKRASVDGEMHCDVFDGADLSCLDQCAGEREDRCRRPAEADQQCSADLTGGIAHPVGGNAVEREGLLDQNMRPRAKRRDDLFLMGDRRRGDDDDVRLFLQRVPPVGEGPRYAELGRELLGHRRVRARERDEFDPRIPRQGRQMARLRPGAGRQNGGANPRGSCHLPIPAVSAPMTWRWKRSTSTTGGRIDMTVAAASAFQLNCCTDWKPARSGGTVSWLVSTSA